MSQDAHAKAVADAKAVLRAKQKPLEEADEAVLEVIREQAEKLRRQVGEFAIEAASTSGGMIGSQALAQVRTLCATLAVSPVKAE